MDKPTITEAENFVPLTRVSFDAKVNGLFAQVRSVQSYQNAATKPIEAVYVFPMPEGAAVTSCTLLIGQKKIEAELKESAKAREEYDVAVQQGHHAALVEQKRDNIFRMNVGGIEPGEDVRVELTYLQRVDWQQGGGRFVIPLVVAPRFIPGNPIGKAGGGWSDDTDVVPDASQITPVVNAKGVPYAAEVNLVLSPGFACKVSSPSHEFLVHKKSLDVDQVYKIKHDKLKTDRDFIVCYQSTAKQPALTLHMGEFKGDTYGCLSMFPGESNQETQKDAVLLLDISGSMQGAKIEGMKEVAKKVTQRLATAHAENRVGVVAFDDEVSDRVPLSRVGEHTYAAISSLRYAGGTYAGKALNHAFALLRNGSKRDSYILLITDGQTHDRWSPVQPGSARVVAVGIDTATNLEYLKSIALESGGVHASVFPGEDYDVVSQMLAGFLSGPLLKDIDLSVGSEGVSNVVGCRNAFQDYPATLFFKIKKLPSVFKVVGIGPDSKTQELSVKKSSAQECVFVHQLWAREMLRGNNVPVDEQVKISMEHGILCNHTSFVAVSIKEVPGQKPERVEVEVELPHTWQMGSDASGAGFGLTSMSATRMRSARLVHHVVAEESFAITSSGYDDTVLGEALTPDPVLSALITDASRVVERLKQLVVDAKAGGSRSVLQAEWQDVVKLLEGELNAGKLSVLQKAEAYLAILQLKPYSFRPAVSASVMRALGKEPAQSEMHAYSVWQQARQEMGVKV